ncbi:transcriptional regulator, partial [Escherichia coli]|nr:transcriptional regulator [Escherichia coli]
MFAVSLRRLVKGVEPGSKFMTTVNNNDPHVAKT